MRHFGVTIFSGLVFLAAAFFAGAIPISSGNVSQGTELLGRYRETSPVKQGVSQDGLLAITLIRGAPAVPPRAKSANHERTLRAFFSSNRAGALMLYLESVKPHEYYALSGAFVVLGKYPVLTWTSETTLAFYGVSEEGKLMHYTIDVHLGTLSLAPIDPITTIPTSSLPSPDLLP